MSGAIPPLPRYAFMAWCSVINKLRENKWGGVINQVKGI